MQYDYLQQRSVMLLSQWEATLQMGHGINIYIYIYIYKYSHGYGGFQNCTVVSFNEKSRKSNNRKSKSFNPVEAQNIVADIVLFKIVH